MVRKIEKYIPHSIVFVSSMGIMIIELLASRIISKYFGNSLYTWTGIIGICLAGISLGNYLGGKIADKHKATRSAPLLLILASALTLLMLVLDLLIGFAMDNVVFGNTFFMISAAVVVIFIFFFPPAAALGTISPIMAKYAIEQNKNIGSTVGSIYASGAVGSIVGTFLSGFVLVPLLGVRSVVFLVACIIAVLPFLLRSSGRIVFLWLSFLGLLFIFSIMVPRFPSFGSKEETVLYETDSMYSHIAVKDQSSGERVLIMDGLIHNRYDPENPEKLLYEYERIFQLATEEIVMNRLTTPDFSTLTLGGGALTFPVHLEDQYSESINDVVEIDPEVIEIAYSYFDVPRETDIRIHIQDARQFVRSASGKRQYDIIYLDVFDSFSIPFHLTTEEFLRNVFDLLKPEGFLLVNLIDILSLGKFLGAFTNTLEEVFPHYSVYTEEPYSEGARSTFVIIAGKKESDFGIMVSSRGERFSPLAAEVLKELQKRNNSIVLTDNHAPVENLIAPVFLQAIQ